MVSAKRLEILACPIHSRQQIAILEKVKQDRGLTSEEENLIRQIKDDLTQLEKRVKKEIRDININNEENHGS